MTQTGVTWRFTVNVRGGAGAEAEAFLENHLDVLMVELLKLEACNPAIHDPSVGGSLAQAEVEIELLVDYPADQAVGMTRDFIRAAIHAAGGFTRSWDIEAVEPVHAVEYEPETTQLAYAS